MIADTVLHLSYPLAFAAGLVSFLSPCVFPLAPAYLAFLGGQAGEGASPAPVEVRAAPAEAGGGGGVAVATRTAPAPVAVATKAPLIANGAAFVAGFSAVFIAFYYVLRALDVTVLVTHQRAVDIVAGSIVIVLALQTLGVLRIGALMREVRIHALPERGGLIGGFLLGVTFAAGWTPCIGPQLSAILSVAQDGRFDGLPVMVAYCLGLAVPFMLLAALTDRLQGAIRAVNRHLGVVNLVAGALLLVFGVLLLADRFSLFSHFAVQSPFDL
ncbi:MAG TPA: cytochrome c biogenesis protein CcdA [Candidatus Dormibacteraeota bacterium]|nr:cytochrome c biogenesis protein CcdA [Candidatus Dormibacteraeota bacterium]